MAQIIRGKSPVRHARVTITFTGAAGAGAAGTAVTVFTTTGRVILHALTAFCTTSLTEALAGAVVSLGTTSQVTRFVGATTSVDIDVDEWWVSSTPTAGSIDLPDAMQSVIVAENIIVNPTVQNTNGGVIVFDALYEAITDNGALS